MEICSNSSFQDPNLSLMLAVLVDLDMLGLVHVALSRAVNGTFELLVVFLSGDCCLLRLGF